MLLRDEKLFKKRRNTHVEACVFTVEYPFIAVHIDFQAHSRGTSGFSANTRCSTKDAKGRIVDCISFTYTHVNII